MNPLAKQPSKWPSPFKRHAYAHFKGLNGLRPFTSDETRLYTQLLELLEENQRGVGFSTRRRAEQALNFTTEALVIATQGLVSRSILGGYSGPGKSPGSRCDWILSSPAPYAEIIIPSQVLEQVVSWPARVLLSEVVGLQITWGLAFAEDTYFTDRLRMPLRNMRAALRELVAAGLLRQDIRQDRIPERILFPFPAPIHQ